MAWFGGQVSFSIENLIARLLNDLSISKKNFKQYLMFFGTISPPTPFIMPFVCIFGLFFCPPALFPLLLSCDIKGALRIGVLKQLLILIS